MALTEASAFKDGSIVNDDINASAAIAGTKISPDFGSQNITTSGHIDLPDASTIKLGDSDEFQIQHTAGGASLISETGSGNLEIRATNINLKDSNANNKLTTNSLGVAITGNLDVSNGADITGNITVTGTVDGRDIATDGTKLDTLSVPITPAVEVNQRTSDFTTSSTSYQTVMSVTITPNSNSSKLLVIAGGSFKGSTQDDGGNAVTYHLKLKRHQGNNQVSVMRGSSLLIQEII